MRGLNFKNFPWEACPRFPKNAVCCCAAPNLAVDYLGVPPGEFIIDHAGRQEVLVKKALDIILEEEHFN